MSDNPGLSCSLIDPYVRAGVRYCFFAPNQWNPIRSTIWKMRKKMLTSHPDYNNPDLQGGGNRIAVSYDLDLPMVFRWKAPGGKESLLVWCSTHYGRGYERLGLTSGVRPSFIAGAEARMPEFLRILESKYPYDVWLAGVYCDDEWPNTGFADFAADGVLKAFTRIDESGDKRPHDATVVRVPLKEHLVAFCDEDYHGGRNPRVDSVAAFRAH